MKTEEKQKNGKKLYKLKE